MNPIPVDVIDGVLDHAAIGISAIAAIATVVAVWVAIGQARHARVDAAQARAESARLRERAARRETAHHTEIMEVQKAAAERERRVRLDAFARDAAQVSRAARVRLVWELAHELVQGVDLEDDRQEELSRQISVGFFNGTDLDVWIEMRVDDAWVDLDDRGGRRERAVSVAPNDWHRQTVTRPLAVSSGPPQIDVWFDDSRSNRWRVDQENYLHLSSPRIIDVEDFTFGAGVP